MSFPGICRVFLILSAVKIKNQKQTDRHKSRQIQLLYFGLVSRLNIGNTRRHVQIIAVLLWATRHCTPCVHTFEYISLNHFCINLEMSPNTGFLNFRQLRSLTLESMHNLRFLSCLSLLRTRDEDNVLKIYRSGIEKQSFCKVCFFNLFA